MINFANSISFKGMTPYQVKNFVPTIAYRNAVDLSRLIDQQVHSRDVFEVAGKNVIHHLMKIGDEYTVMRVFKYDGPDEEIPRVNFIGKIVSIVSQGLDYK